MLIKLTIHNYAIIDSIDIDFSKGLNIITGETGAGKSILVGALSMILGDRADASLLLNKEKKCIIEGLFHISSMVEVKERLRENDLDNEDELLIRREINANGKSRAFINDTPVTLEVLRKISMQLVDLHRQFDTLELGESDFQRQVLDALANNAALLSKYQEMFRRWKKSRRELDEILERKSQLSKEYDYNLFLYEELEKAGLKENEIEEAESALKLLENSEGIKKALLQADYELKDGEAPILQKIKLLENQLSSFSVMHPSIGEICARLHSAQVELLDIAGDISHINDKVQYDPKKIEELNERISEGYRLLKKHSVQTTAELISIQSDINKKLEAVQNIEEEIVEKEKMEKDLRESLGKLGDSLSRARKKQTGFLENEVNRLLHQVGMPNAALKAVVSDAEPDLYGRDAIEFLFDANKSKRFEPIRKVASGGELSRLMLCIKSLVAQSVDLPTMIFDEIDTGISGEAARQVSLIMKELSLKRQMIAITHQPQIAGRADAHFFVYKEISGDSIKTNIRLLGMEERITAIAQMLSGEKPTAAALQNAREMVMN